MPIEVIVPRLGWSMNEGTFAGWLKNDGDVVREGDLLFTLESDKATQDVEAFDGGILRLPTDTPRSGDTVVVGQVIGYVCTADESSPMSLPEFVPTEEINELLGTAPPAEVEITASQTPALATNDSATNRNSNRVRISPRAARKAAELGVALTQVQGTGRGRRIRERDVLAHQEQQMTPAAISAGDLAACPTSQLRHLIAERTLAASQQTAPVTLTSRADATNLVALRRQFRQPNSSEGIVPSFSDLFIKLSAIALTRHPEIRRQWTDRGLVMPVGIHVCVAVDTDEGLIVPVLRDVDQLTLSQVSRRMRDLIDRTRRRQIMPDELEGGVFTISNLGQFRVDAFTPVLHVPQAAILGIGRIRPEPAVHLGEIAVRDMVTLSLTFDHRVVDGAPAARFLDTLVELVELPAPSLIG